MRAFKFDYELHADMIREWGKKHEFPLPPSSFLPSSGFVIEDICCGFLYVSNSAIGWVEWVFSNPKKSKEERDEAIDMLFKVLEMTAKELKMGALFSVSAIPVYSKILERHGFTETDQKVTHYIKLLGGE